ncbi:hypothetical protein ACLI1A_10845 [Flavobacterium sp. RHBU_3]|uniref:hypothetical protein n=1 Tax=Flavobacterium sp. RHBU_3 TaxID=3391184 RepID=UPI00398547CD
MKKKHSKLGTYSNDGLSIGFNGFSDDTLDEMRKIVLEDYENIEIDLQRQLLRLDDYLKKTFGALFRTEDFVKWFFDKKKITQWGSNLPKINDAELITYSRIYINELNELTKDISIQRIKKTSIIWIKDEADLMKLSNYLYTNSFIETEKDFHTIISDPTFKQRVNWLKTKTLLIYLFERIKELEYIPKEFSENSFIENNFLISGKIIENVKQSKDGKKKNKNSKPKNHILIDAFFDTN